MIDLRQARPEDNEGLIHLSKEAPMRGLITVYVDRSPVYGAFSTLKGDKAKDWVAVEGGEVVACFSTAQRKARYNGGIYQYAYGGDLRVHPKARGTRLSTRILKHALDRNLEEGAELGEAVILEGNTRALGLHVWAEHHVRIVHAGMIGLFQVLPYRKYKEIPGYTVREATESDIPSILEILEERYRDYACAPIFDEAWLRSELSQTTSFTLQSFRIALDGDRKVACAAFWDQESLRRIVVEKFSASAKCLVGTLRALRPLLGFPRPPRPGESLRHVFTRFPAARQGHERALAAIVRRESNLLRKEGKHQFIYAAFHEADPLVSCIDGMWKARIKTNLFHYSPKDQEAILLPPGEAPKRPAYVDFSLV